MSVIRLATTGLAAAFSLASANALADVEAIITKSGCAMCHKADTVMVGPSYVDIAARYAGEEGAVDKLVASVREGSTGKWGQVPMMPTNSVMISDEDLRSVIAWILEQ